MLLSKCLTLPLFKIHRAIPVPDSQSEGKPIPERRVSMEADLSLPPIALSLGIDFKARPTYSRGIIRYYVSQLPVPRN